MGALPHGGGVAFLLAQFGVLALPSLWRLWPATFWVMGMGSLLERKPGGAATFGLMGLAFFAAQFGWFGLSISHVLACPRHRGGGGDGDRRAQWRGPL